MGDRLDTRASSPCGDSPLCACHSERHGEAYLNLAYAGFAGLRSSFSEEPKVALVSATPPATPRVVSLEIMRCQLPGTNGGSSDLAFCELHMARRSKWRNRRLALSRFNEPAAILGNEWGKASAARRNRTLNHAHKIWL
jgi:hypothetical protein